MDEKHIYPQRLENRERIVDVETGRCRLDPKLRYVCKWNDSHLGATCNKEYKKREGTLQEHVRLEHTGHNDLQQQLTALTDRVSLA